MLANLDNTTTSDILPSENSIHQRWAYIFGVAFQISDDLQDIDQDLEHGKPNICSLIPVSSATSLLDYLSDWLKSQLVEIGKQPDINCKLLEEIITMLSQQAFIVPTTFTIDNANSNPALNSVLKNKL